MDESDALDSWLLVAEYPRGMADAFKLGVLLKEFFQAPLVFE